MNSCVFCKIAKGELPASFIYKDDKIMSFMDIAPAGIGHCLIVPCQHVEYYSELPFDLAAGVGKLAVKIGRALLHEFGADGINYLVCEGKTAGQIVPHVHLHLVPRYSDDGLGLGRWQPGKADFADLAKQAKNIADNL